MNSNSFLIIDRNIFDDNYYRDNLDNNAIIAYILLGDRYKVSLKNHWFDHKYNESFIYYKIDDLAHDLRKSPGVAVKALKQLKNVGLLKKRRMYKESSHLFLPLFRFRNQRNFNFKHSEMSKTARQSNNNSNNNKHTSKTVNTKTGKNQHRFKPASRTSCWKDSATKMGLTLDTIDQIASFSNTYNQSAYQITHFITEARNIIANKYHVTKHDRRFEINQPIIDRLAKKLRILFSHITSKDDHKAKLNNYAGFLINSLKRFFKWAFGEGRDETVKPKTDNRHFSGYYKRKPIKEGKPQWMKDQEAGKTPKPQKTGKLLTKLIQARNAYDSLTMQVDDPTRPNPDYDKLITLKKRRDDYQKLYNDKREASKSTPKPKKQTKQTELPKTDPALQREIQARLRRLGEI